MVGSLKIETYSVIYERDLSALIAYHYNRPYRIQQFWELGQSSFFFLEVDDGEEVDGWCNTGKTPAEYIDEWLAIDHTQFKYDFEFMRQHGLDPALLCNDLCKLGIIPAATYLVLVDW